jgi:NAD(P)H-nitrite reductase large subunit
MSDEDLICICMSVTRGEIKKALADKCKTLDDLKNTLFCCTGCGTCEGRVQKIIDEQGAMESPSAEQTK